MHILSLLPCFLLCPRSSFLFFASSCCCYYLCVCVCVNFFAIFFLDVENALWYYDINIMRFLNTCVLINFQQAADVVKAIAKEIEAVRSVDGPLLQVTHRFL